MVLHRITWPHELVYSAKDQPMAYDNLSVLLSVSGYLAMMEKEKVSINASWLATCKSSWLIQSSMALAGSGIISCSLAATPVEWLGAMGMCGDKTAILLLFSVASSQTC